MFRCIVFVVSLLCLQGCGLVALTGATTGMVVAQDRRTAGTMLDDKTITFKALSALSQDTELWTESRITPISYNGVLLLLGQTPNDAMKQRAEKRVSDLPKVRHIYNELTLEAPISMRQRTHDSWITTQIKAKLIANKNIRSNHIKIVTENGVVYLLGVTTPEEELMATDIARSIPGVEKVVQIFEHTARTEGSQGTEEQ